MLVGLDEMSSLRSSFLKITISLLVIFAFIGLVVPISPCESENNAKRKITCTQMSNIKNVLNVFKTDNGTYPSTKEGINILLSNSNIDKYPNYPFMPYLEKLPTDPWSSEIHYVQEGDKFILLSYGADRKKGGEDEEEDIIFPDCLDSK